MPCSGLTVWRRTWGHVVVNEIYPTGYSMPARAISSAAVFLLALLTLSACGNDGPALSQIGQDAVVLAFGDSLTHGTGAKAHQSYPERLASHIDREVIRAGVPGEISADGLARLPDLLDEHEPDLVVLCHGGNDILRNIDAADTKSNLREMVQLIRDTGAQVVLIGVPAKGLFLSTAAIYMELAEEVELPIEDTIVSDILGDNDLKSDAVHPNAAGYEAMAAAIAALLRARGAI